MPTMKTMSERLHPITAYRIAVATLLAALVGMGCLVRWHVRELFAARNRAEIAAYAAVQERERADAAQAWAKRACGGEAGVRAANQLALDAAYRVQKETRRAIAEEVASGGTILTPEIDGDGPRVEPGVPDAKARQAIIGGTEVGTRGEQ